VARIAAFGGYTLDLRRATVTLAVVAAHVALIIVMLRSAGSHSADVVDITLFALPINPEERLREPVHVVKPETAPRRAGVAREAVAEQHVERSSGSENNTLGDTAAGPAGAVSEPARAIDWRGEIETSARTLEQQDSMESGRRSLAAGPKQQALSGSAKTPACPFEKCEPGWGENLGIFKPSLHSKAGRVEKIPSNTTITSDGSLDITGEEMILWINNWCYSVLVSADRLHRGAIRCVAPVGKTPARGDLFDHMHEGKPTESHDTDGPWISYGLSIGGSRQH
jgi:hypothetical protein